MMDDLLDEKGKQIFEALAKEIPNFSPVLDEPLLTMYVNLLQRKETLLKEIEEAENEQSKQVRRGILADTERMIQETAPELGLTPASRREIENNMKVKKAFKRDGDSDDNKN